MTQDRGQHAWTLDEERSREIIRHGLEMGINFYDTAIAYQSGTIPLLNEWLADGMSMGSAAAFMLTGPAAKITNLGAMKIVLGWKRFILYLAFVMLFSLCTGLIVDLF